jgi:hypothetical protein
MIDSNEWISFEQVQVKNALLNHSPGSCMQTLGGITGNRDHIGLQSQIYGFVPEECELYAVQRAINQGDQ